MFSTSRSGCYLCRGYKSSVSMQVTLTASLQVMSMPATSHKSTCFYNIPDSTGCLCRWAIYLLPYACIATLLLYACCAFELVLPCACSVDIDYHAVLILSNLLLKSEKLPVGFKQVTAWQDKLSVCTIVACLLGSSTATKSISRHDSVIAASI